MNWIKIGHFVGFFACMTLCLGLKPGFAESSAKKAVVKIYTVCNAYSYHNPWQMKGQKSFHGSGCIISDNRILTNAHVVSDQIFVEVRRAGKAKRYTARVEAVAHESDLAILKVDDKEFFRGVEPVAIGSLSKIRDTVAVYGFPDGGDKLSVTEGIVSRVEHVNFAHSRSYLLACQIDAPINSGNSGGPVIKDDKIVGVAFQGMAGGKFDNIGYMVSPPVIRHFLKDLQDGRHDGTPSLGVSMQKLENPGMRLSLRMNDKHTGVLVNTVYPNSPVAGKIRRKDIILSIDGTNVANDGTIEFREGERTFFGYLMQKKYINDQVRLQILRQGQPMTVNIALTQPMDFDRLVPHMQHDRPPTYFIYGGLVFEPLTLNYLKEFGDENNWYLYAPAELMHYYLNGESSDARQELVILTKVLADSANIGFHKFVNNIIQEVNNKNISKIEDVIHAIKDHDGEYNTFTDARGFTIVLNREVAKQSIKRILKKYKIKSDRSDDLMSNVES